MTHCNTDTDDIGLVPRDRVTTLVKALISTAVMPGSAWSYESLSAATRIKPRRLKSYVHENVEPPLSVALSIGVVLGKPAINAVLSLIGYGGACPLDEGDERKPRQMVIKASQCMATLIRCAADDIIDHTEERDTTEAADTLIAELIPFSSAGKAA